MQRFKKYIDKDVKIENVKNADQISAFGVTTAYIPDPMEDFDEIGFNIDFGDEIILIGIGVVLGKIKRVMFTLTDKQDPEVFRGLTESQLKDFLAQKADNLVNFFDYIT